MDPITTSTIDSLIDLIMDLAGTPTDKHASSKSEFNRIVAESRPPIPPALGFSPHSAHGYVFDLPDNQWKILEAAATSDDGFVSRADALALLGRDPTTGSLKSFTRPYERVLRDMKASGRLPKHAVKPIEPVYDPSGPTRQRTSGFQMPVELILIFRTLV